MKLTHPMAKAVERAMLSDGDYHAKMMMVARYLVNESSPDRDERIIDALYEASQRVTRRRMTRGEIGRIVDWLRKRPAGKYESSPRKREVDEEFTAKVDELEYGLVDLWEASPLRLDEDAPPAGELLKVLYPDDPYLCIGWSVSNFHTQRTSEWVSQPLDGAQYLAPNPMKASSMDRGDGTHTKKCHELVRERRYLAVEFDGGTLDQQASRLGWLASGRGGAMPLVMVTFSGSKSLHGLFKARGRTERFLSSFYDKAISLGADPMLWTPSQFTRFPFGVNSKTNGRQEVYFFDSQNAAT